MRNAFTPKPLNKDEICDRDILVLVKWNKTNLFGENLKKKKRLQYAA